MDGKLAVRKSVRFVSFALAIVLVIGCSAISGHSLAVRYKQTLEYTYRRALTDLSDYVSNLESTLTKGVYANTAPQQYGLSSKLLSESNSAKSALGQLPLSDIELDNVNKFISQVGGYASYLSKKLSKGETATEEEMKNLQKLGEYAKIVNTDLKDILTRFDDGKLNIGDALKAESSLSKTTQSKSEPYINSGFREMNEGFTDYPTLIYDGPFSDHIMQMKPKFLEDKKEITKDEARDISSKFLNVSKDRLEYVGENNGNLPLYNFSYENTAISITKKGGYVNYILNSRDIDNTTLNFSQASQKAKEFMAKHNINNMKESYYVISNGICTINYAYQKDNIVYYSDLIKVGVALDNGEVVSYNASGYIMNHTQRSIPKDIISIEKARNSVSKNLKINKEAMVFAPTGGLNEALCYEFECTGHNEDQVLVYINAQTGYEEQIFILLMSDGGTTVL